MYDSAQLLIRGKAAKSLLDNLLTYSGYTMASDNVHTEWTAYWSRSHPSKNDRRVTISFS